MQTEIDRACNDAVANDAAPSPNFDNSWSTISDEGAVRIAVQACIDARNQEFINGARPVSVDEIIKDPDAVEGQAFVMVVLITQFDAATGKCAFRGYWDQAQHEYNFEYAGDNALFSSGDGTSTCPALDGIDQNDTIRVWTRSLGSFSYETQIGGNTTVPYFKVLKAEVLKKE